MSLYKNKADLINATLLIFLIKSRNGWHTTQNNEFLSVILRLFNYLKILCGFA